MILPKKNPTSLKAWKALVSHFEQNQSKTILDHFKDTPNRLDHLSITWWAVFASVTSQNTKPSASQVSYGWNDEGWPGLLTLRCAGPETTGAAP